MAQPDRTNSSQHKRSLDWLDSSSAWAQDEYGALSTAASEPYDWTLKDGAIQSTQVIPIVSPVQSDSAKLRWLRRKADASESSTTIPLEKGVTGKLFGRGLTKRLNLFTRPLAPDPLVESDGTDAPRRSPGFALPLLLLSVIALFVFAYIAQK
ncbi:MAG: hypothetical protein ACREA2_22175 [Blastocatellia bacterium]